MAKPEVTCTSSFCSFFLQNKVSTLIFIDILWLFLIPREARPKASRSGVYNFVPQRAQAG